MNNKDPSSVLNACDTIGLVGVTRKETPRDQNRLCLSICEGHMEFVHGKKTKKINNKTCQTKNKPAHVCRHAVFSLCVCARMRLLYVEQRPDCGSNPGWPAALIRIQQPEALLGRLADWGSEKEGERSDRVCG